jgi:hypothetical protein
MSNLSLQSSIRTCKIVSGNAPNIESDRFLNSNLVVCPVWNHRDLTGRYVCEDSFYTKRAGFNTALDRVDVENFLRPQYAEYIALDTSGYRHDIYKNNMFHSEAKGNTEFLNQREKYTGNYGLDLGADVVSSCNMNSYSQAMAQESQYGRMNQALQEGYQANRMKTCSGF